MLYFPVSIRDGNSRNIVSDGIPNPTPCEPVTAAEVIPTTLPYELSKGPPEFPGLIEALNWIASGIVKVPEVD